MHSKRRTLMLLLLTPLLQHPPILVHVQPSLCSLWAAMRGVQGWSCLCVQTQVYSAQQAPCKWEPLPLWGLTESHCCCPRAQRAEAAVGSSGLESREMAWCNFIFSPLDSVVWVSQTRSLKAAGNVSFKCLIYFLCKRKVLAVFITE